MDKARMSHVVIKTQNIAESKRFYDTLCKFMGLKQVYSSKSGFAYYNENFSVWVNRTSKKGRFLRGDPGYDHVAFSADSRRQVDGLQKELKRGKFKILYPAEEHPEFSPGYYSVSFFDPDGTIIEFLYQPESKKAYG